MRTVSFLIRLSIFLICYSNVFCKLLDTSGVLLSRQKRYLVWKEGINWVQLIVGVGIPIEIRDQSITLGTVAKAYYLLPDNSSYYTHPSIDYARRKRSATRWTVYGLIETFLKRMKICFGSFWTHLSYSALFSTEKATLCPTSLCVLVKARRRWVVAGQLQFSMQGRYYIPVTVLMSSAFGRQMPRVDVDGTFGYGDGKACLLRSICEASSMPFDKRTGILSEIVHAVLTPSSTREDLDNYVDSEYHAAERLGKNVDSCSSVFPECSISLVQQFSKFLS